MGLDVLKALDSGSGCILGDYKFLYGFVSLIKPKRIVEIGTNYGLSAITMALALRDSELTESKIISIDISLGCLEKAQAQINQLGLSNYVKLIHGDSSIIDEHPPFDLAFIDGDHSLEGCLEDFERLKDKATYIIIHDSTSIDAVGDAIKAIRETGKYDVLNIDVGNMGSQWSLNKIVCRAYSGMALVKKKYV